jgi:hypothetical protein
MPERWRRPSLPRIPGVPSIRGFIPEDPEDLTPME